MSTTLNLADRLLAMGRNYHELGREHDALHVLRRLAGLQELRAEVAEETQSRLAEICLRCRQYKRARRHLTAALRHQPDSAHYHYLMATALEEDDAGDLERAAKHYRQALKLDPEHQESLAALGLLAVEMGQVEEGLKCLRRLVDLVPDDAEAVGQLVTGLRLAGRTEEARATLLTVRFRNPRDARFQKLWSDFQFQELRRDQEAARQDRRAQAAEEGPVLLPFVRVVPETPSSPSGGSKVLRRDAASLPGPPHLPRPARRPDQRHAW
jgi:tetratricopeptide (TPR) repeat protein